MRRLLALAIVLASPLAAAPTAAERLIASLTNHRVMITSNYTGVELVLFGSVERDAASIERKGPYDIVATITGPRESLRTRRKQRVLGIWVNTAARTFVDPPSYLAVLASRPLDAITNAANRRRLRIGIANTPLPELIHNDIGEVANDPFRAALVRLMRERGLYNEEPDAVTFLHSRARSLIGGATPSIARWRSHCWPAAFSARPAASRCLPGCARSISST